MQHDSKIQIRSAAREDINALMALERRVFAADSMSRKSIRHFLETQSASVVVAEAGCEIVGCAIVLFHPLSPKSARLYSLAVAPEHEGRGIGPLLVKACEDAARAHDRCQLRLEVHERNARAITLYRKQGYAQFARRCGYYKDFGDALRFRKELH
jgi:ribosomal protein S18 acetylase RimI-like enzyme